MRVLAIVMSLWVTGCVASPGLPPAAPCDQYAALMGGTVPMLERAPFGVRIVVDPTFVSFDGSATYPLPTGRLVMEPWVYHDADGDRLGAIGLAGLPGECRWFAPLR